jgi:FMN phosphatase YigB (HAD superfamily)
MIKHIIFDFFNVLYPYSDEATLAVEAMRSSGFKLGAISSLNMDTLKEVADHYKIDYVFSPCATCLKKTDPLIYERYLQEYKFKGEECVMVDDLQENLAAAKKVGIQTVWLQLGDEQKNDSVDFVIKNIKDLINIKFKK